MPAPPSPSAPQNLSHSPNRHSHTRALLFWIVGALLLAVGVHLGLRWHQAHAPVRIAYSTFLEHVRVGELRHVEVVNGVTVRGTYTQDALRARRDTDGENGTVQASDAQRPHVVASKPEAHALIPLLRRHNQRVSGTDEAEITYTAVQTGGWAETLFRWGLLGAALIGAGAAVLWMSGHTLGRRTGQGQAAPLFEEARGTNVTFDDVAGLDDVKAEVEEVVDILRRPQAVTQLGGTLPTGVLLVGPPGTGKTLLAKAVAGEAGVPFLSISGSEFMELFMGMGASRVRELFETAKERAPCIIFIDEIDAIGRARGEAGAGSGAEERANTLNQLLVEMDGFDSDAGVILMAATNRPDVLDPALRRPGRFDRHVFVPTPDRRARAAIFRVHAESLRVADDIDLDDLARRTPGLAGAEIANVCNEAALRAARTGKSSVQREDFEDAIDRVVAGLERQSRLISPEERRVIAYHEAGHALTGWVLPHTAPVLKVSIVPRGAAALGRAQVVPQERDLYSKDALMNRLVVALAGRAAEAVALQQVTTSAEDDLKQATELAYAMVTQYGMSRRVGPLRPQSPHGPRSAALREAIDEEVQGVIADAQARAESVLREQQALLSRVAEALLRQEVLDANALRALLGPPPQPQATQDGSSPESDPVHAQTETTTNEAS